MASPPLLTATVGDLDVELRRGEVVAVAGPSGSGKTTLLHILAGLQPPGTGRVTAHPPLSSGSPARLPWREMAFVPQGLGLLEEFTLRENVLLPCDEDRPPETRLMDLLGISRLRDRYPAEVSRGEQQRAAIARALLPRPHVVLADEPTAHQDHDHAMEIVNMLRERARQGGAILVAGHHQALIDAADRVIRPAGLPPWPGRAPAPPRCRR